MKLTSKKGYMLFSIVIGIIIVLSVLGGLGYLTKSQGGATPPPPGTDPEMVPGKVLIENVTSDGRQLTISFQTQGCSTCSVKFTGTATLASGVGIPIDKTVAPGLTSTTFYISDEKVMSVDLQGYQTNEGLKLEGNRTPFAKRF